MDDMILDDNQLVQEIETPTLWQKPYKEIGLKH